MNYLNNSTINPFITTGYVGPEFFCDREKETEDLVRLLTNGNNVALISPRRYGKKLEPGVVEELYKRYDGVTYYIQCVMNSLFASTSPKETCVLEDINKAEQSIVDTSSPIYEDLLYQLPEKQSRVLIAIGREGKASNITSGKFVKKHGLVSPNSVKAAIPALIDKGLLTMERGVYQVYDKFFNLWLIQNV